MNYDLNAVCGIACDRDIYTQLVCRAVVQSHQADWWCKRRLHEDTAGPEACVWRRRDNPYQSQFVQRTTRTQDNSFPKQPVPGELLQLVGVSFTTIIRLVVIPGEVRVRGIWKTCNQENSYRVNLNQFHTPTGSAQRSIHGLFGLVSLTDVLIGWRASDCDAPNQLLHIQINTGNPVLSPTWRASPTWR